MQVEMTKTSRTSQQSVLSLEVLHSLPINTKLQHKYCKKNLNHVISAVSLNVARPSTDTGVEQAFSSTPDYKSHEH